MTRRRRRPSLAGKRYEQVVARIHRQFAGMAEVTDNEFIRGRSGQVRQIDLAIRTQVAGYEVLVIVECKDYKRRVDIQRVDEIIGKIADVGAAKGVLVSDSGFTQGALNRAKEDGLIQLVSVIDTHDPQLRSQIYLPVQIAFHEFEWPLTSTLRVTRHPSHPLLQQDFNQNELALAFENELYELTDIYEKPLRKEFYAWYSENSGTLKAGEHTFTHTLLDNDSIAVVGECTFKKIIRHFVNENVFARGAGIYDHVSQKIVAGDDLKKIHLDFEAIKATWREVPEGFVLERCKTFFALVHKLRPESVDAEPPYLIKRATR